jgi:hypothetical protein
MAVTYRSRERAMPYRTRLTGRLMSITMRGSAESAGPLAIFAGPGRPVPADLCLATAISCHYCWNIDQFGQGDLLSRILPCARVATALTAVAIAVAGCATANNGASNQGEQPYPTGYGLSSAGTTTSLYTELFGPSKAATPPAAATAAAEPAQSTTPPATALAVTLQSRPATASSAARQAQPAAAPVEVAQQPAAAQAPAEPDVPVAYGITASGPTTNLYTELFGPKRRDGQ